MASITSAPAGAARLRPIAAIVSPSHRMSATYWSVAVVIWPFLMSSDMSCLANFSKSGVGKMLTGLLYRG